MAAAFAPALLVDDSSHSRVHSRQSYSQITQVQPLDIAPWLYTVLEQIHELENNPQHYPGVASLGVTRQTAMYARAVLASLHSIDLPNPVVTPLSGNALGIAWSVGARELEAVIYPDNVTSFVASDRHEVVADGELREKNTAPLEEALIQLLRA
jgi:hypothetical protein